MYHLVVLGKKKEKCKDESKKEAWPQKKEEKEKGDFFPSPVISIKKGRGLCFSSSTQTPTPCTHREGNRGREEEEEEE